MENVALITALAVEHEAAWKRFDELDTASPGRNENIDAAQLSAESLTLALATIPAATIAELAPKVAAFRKLASSDPTPRIFGHLVPSERTLAESILRDIVKLV